jgi:putative NADH-flavin reductase
MARVIVFGAGGRTGRAVVDAALLAGHQVSAALRDPSGFGPVAAGGPGLLRADVRDPASVRTAVRGHDAVVSAIGPPGRRADGHYSAAARAFVDALPAAGIPRLVVLSSSGARDDDPAHPLWYRVVARTVLRELYADMRRMEEIIAASALDWTVVRPTRIVDEPAAGRYRIGNAANPPAGTSVARADLAAFVVGEVEDGAWSRRHPTLAA